MVGLQEKDFFPVYKQALADLVNNGKQDKVKAPEIRVMRASHRNGFHVYLNTSGGSFKLSSLREDVRRFGKLETVAELMKKHCVQCFTVVDFDLTGK